MFLSLFGSAPGLPYGEALLFSIFLERFAPLLQGLVQGEFAWYDWPMESTAIEFAYAVYDRYVKSVRTSLDAWAMTAWGFCPPKKSSVWPRVAERRFQRRNALLRKIRLHAVAVRERVGGLGLAVVCAGRQCERTASVLPVRGLPGSIIALVVKDTADGVSSQILKGAQVTAMESDSAVSVIETGSSGQRTQQMLDHLADKVNGVILSTDAPGISFIRDYAKRVPLVVLNRPLEGVASVVPDPRIGTVRAEPAETLAVTYVAGPAASWANQSRWPRCMTSGTAWDSRSIR